MQRLSMMIVILMALIWFSMPNVYAAEAPWPIVLVRDIVVTPVKLVGSTLGQIAIILRDALFTPFRVLI